MSPLDGLSLKDLSCKLVTLIALTYASAGRGQTLQALDLNHMSIESNHVLFVINEKLKTSNEVIMWSIDEENGKLDKKFQDNYYKIHCFEL